jgi:trehalose 6-phosphate synthase/phosphatase
MIRDNNLLQKELFYKYTNSEKKVILLDYDGTLVEYKPKPDQAIPPEFLLNLLGRLSEKEGTEVIIISGRDHQEIEKFLGDLPIDIIAEHGAMLKKHGIWKKQTSDDLSWKETIRPLMIKMSLKCSDSFVEDKHYSLAWHYRKMGQNPGYTCSRELIKTTGKYLESLDLKILDGNMVVEIMKKGIGKGIAVKKLVDGNDYDFILSIGDDVTDEEMFEFFLSDPRAITIKVGYGKTFAKNKVTDINDVMLLLKKLSQ